MMKKRPMIISFSRIKCGAKTVYYTLRYPTLGVLRGSILYGHDFAYLDEVCEDHWHMACRDCGYKVASEIGPDAKIDEI
jgi:hypothetical protein